MLALTLSPYLLEIPNGVYIMGRQLNDVINLRYQVQHIAVFLYFH